MDSAVIPLRRHKNLSLVQTIDFFYPLIDNPKLMGKIALANVLSDLYAVGVTVIDKLSLVASSPTELTDEQRDIVMPMIIEGFNEAAQSAGCKVSVRNIALNPWCIIGGVATSICTDEEIVMPTNAVSGDVVILTKPLGTQLATNSLIWMQENNEKFQKLSEYFTREDIEETFNIAVKSMTHLNRIGGILMHKYDAHAATDVTGFGLLGHAKNLAQFQRAKVNFIIEKLPIIKNVKRIAEIVGQTMKLFSGTAVETSGGLLICLSASNAEKFCEEYKLMTNQEQKQQQNAWIVGKVVDGNGDAILVNKPEFLEVNLPY